MIDMKAVNLVVCIFFLLAFIYMEHSCYVTTSQLYIDYKTRRPATQAMKANIDWCADVLALSLLLCLFYHISRPAFLDVNLCSVLNFKLFTYGSV